MQRTWQSFVVGLTPASLAAMGFILLASGCYSDASHSKRTPMPEASEMPPTKTNVPLVKLFLGGDVMTGRGIDQVMATPSDAQLFESYVKSAKRYVLFAEQKNGVIAKPVQPAYIWGLLAEFQRQRPDVKIINLETSITTSQQAWPGKGIHYRMHPQNVDCLKSASIDICTLANNHVLDWGRAGLEQTLATLHEAGISLAGAGTSADTAAEPAVIEINETARVLVFAFGTESSGVFSDWAATEHVPGVNLLRDLSRQSVQRIARQVEGVKRAGDVVVVSIHWGGNWGYKVPDGQRRFAHRLIDNAGIDVVFGHSSHHPKGIEVYREKPILYGCGDFINDYEGIGGHQQYRGDLSLMYFLLIDPVTGNLVELEMTPMQIKQFRVNRTGAEDCQWLFAMMQRECGEFGGEVHMSDTGTFSLRWK